MASEMPEKQTARHDNSLPAEAAHLNRAEALHVCPACDSDLVYPTDWAPAQRKQWNVDLRCPNCEWLGGGTYNQAVVDRFDQALDSGTEQLLDDLNMLARANMEEQIQRFVVALHANHILPEDF
jgi:hypothetical protein